MSTSVRQSHQRLDIQGLRAVAVLMVVAFHAGTGLSGGFVGVDVFFVISGFVISAMLNREYEQHQRIRFGRFYRRRFQRLTPALSVVVIASVIMALVIASPLGPQEMTGETAVGAMFLVANIVIAATTGGYFDGPAESNLLLHTWSLSVEEQFYLAFPAMLALGWIAHRRGWKRTPLLIVATASVVSFAAMLFGAYTQLESREAQMLFGFYSPLTRAWEFGVGSMLAFVNWSLLPARARHVLAAAGIVGMAVSAIFISGSMTFPGWWTLVPTLSAAAVIAAGTDGTAPRYGLSSRPMVAIGDWSYSIYLWHWPLIVSASMLLPTSWWALPVAATLAFAPALWSYYKIELPYRSRSDWHGSRLAVAVAVSVLIPSLLGSGLAGAAKRMFWLDDQLPLRDAVFAPHVATGCEASDYNEESCFRDTADGTGRPIYLVGDSTAHHFGEAAFGAGKQLSRPVSVIFVPGCPFKDVYVDASGNEFKIYENCRQSYERALTWLLQQPAGDVVISELNSWYRNDPIRIGNTPSSVTSDPQGRSRALEAGLTRTVEQLKQAGFDVTLVQAAPDFEAPIGFSPTHCSIWTLVKDECVGRLSQRQADAVQSLERASLRRVAAATGSSIWDPRPFFCRESECRTTWDGLPMYRDGFHLSARVSELLAPSLAEALSH